EKQDFESFMVTPDKDFGQLVGPKTFIYKPSRMGEGVEVLGLPETLLKWGIERPDQVIDVLALWGDTSDNIPGVPGIGEKTATKLIAQYGTVENLLTRTSELKGKLKENLETFRDQALLSKKLATINCDTPCARNLDELKIRPRNDDAIKALFVEFEFNSLGRRLYGDDFKAGRGFQSLAKPAAEKTTAEDAAIEELALASETEPSAQLELTPAVTNHKTIAEVPHQYHLVADANARAKLIQTLRGLKSFCFDMQTTSRDAREAGLIGIAFSFDAHTGHYAALASDAEQVAAVLEEFRPLFEDERIEKVGHNLKFDLSVLKWHGITARGKMFDTMVAHSLIEPDMRHGLDYLSEVFLGYALTPMTKAASAESEQASLAAVAPEMVLENAAEQADVAWQLRAKLAPLLAEKGQERVFYEIESPLVPVLVDMEFEGVRVDAAALAEFAVQLSKEMADHEGTIFQLAGSKFNLNSPRQLGQILFEVLKLPAPKKTKTGQYATNE
ncbi:MAG TPA: DNA polymerase, partial [Verrucomicrobiae bacterium]|nr:DNA polymerase [Verrucomicrobiae bacterium]